MKPEYAVSEKDKPRTEFEEICKDLKPDLNNFLFSRVPGGLTIEEFEVIATKIYSEILESWEKFI
jgi:hypothetical protein